MYIDINTLCSQYQDIKVFVYYALEHFKFDSFEYQIQGCLSELIHKINNRLCVMYMHQPEKVVEAFVNEYLVFSNNKLSLEVEYNKEKHDFDICFSNKQHENCYYILDAVKEAVIDKYEQYIDILKICNLSMYVKVTE